MHGRPFGGTAVVIRKNLASRCSRITTNNPRITSVCMKNGGDAPDVVISSVYMPSNDRTVRQISEFEGTVGCLQGIIDRFAGCLFMFGGDFNVTERAMNECSQRLHEFCSLNNLHWLQYDKSGPTYIYHCDSNGHFSILDYFICSPQLSNANDAPVILIDGDNMSDHCAIYATFSIPTAVKLNVGEHSRQISPKLLWDKANIDGYRADVYEHLSKVQLPIEALLCTECCDESHHVDIENYYNSLISCLRSAASNNVPTSKFGFHKHWWSPELEDLKQKCIDVTDIWKSAGKPRSGDINAARLKCKYLYKLAIKEAVELASTEFNDDLYNNLCNKDSTSFWKAWRKRYCSHSIKPTGTLNGHVVDDNIRQVFTDHFKSLYEPNTPCADSDFQKTTEELLQCNSVGPIPFIDIATINVSISSLKYR